MLLHPKVPQGLCSHACNSSEHFWAPQVSAHNAVFRGPNGQNGQCHPDTDLRPGRRLPLPVLANLHLDWRNRHHCHGEAHPVPVRPERATKPHKEVKDSKASSSKGRSLKMHTGTVLVHLQDKEEGQLTCYLSAGSKTRLSARRTSIYFWVRVVVLVRPAGGWNYHFHCFCWPVSNLDGYAQMWHRVFRNISWIS